MTYAVEQDLMDRFGERELIELTDRSDPATGQIDSAVVAKALADADESVNSYIGKRYDLPLAVVPAVLTRVAADIARFFLHADDPTETVEKNHGAALKFLRDLADGRAVLDAAGQEPAATGDGVQVTSQDRVFGRDKTAGF